MQNYFQPKFIDTQIFLEDGKYEINFLDKSRYLGNMENSKIQGEGQFYIQEIGKFEGIFYQNSFLNGTLIFKNILQYKGKFHQDETFDIGTLFFISTQKEIEIETKNSKFLKILIKQNENTEEIGFSSKKNRFVYSDGWVIEILDNFSTLSLQKEYSDKLLDQNKTIIDLTNKIFQEENYSEGRRTGKTYLLNLNLIPYYSEYEQQQENQIPHFYTNSANGNIYDGNLSFKKGLVTMAKQTYVFEGGIDGPNKQGKGFIFFEDNCRKEVEYIKDKLSFENLREVFRFVSDFGCFNHEELLVGKNLEMIRFMNNVKSFKGFLDQGTTQEKCEIVFKNDDFFEGKLTNFKRHGHGILTRNKKKIIGNFYNDILPYGIIEYQMGAVYEGELIDFERSGKGIIIFQSEDFFSGKFLGDIIHKEGGVLKFKEKEHKVLYVHIFEFEFGVFVDKDNEELFLLNCESQTVHDAKLLDKLKESGIDIKQSLRDMKVINQFTFFQDFEILLDLILSSFFQAIQKVSLFLKKLEKILFKLFIKKYKEKIEKFLQFENVVLKIFFRKKIYIYFIVTDLCLDEMQN